MTTPDVAAIEACLAAATPGEWKARSRHYLSPDVDWFLGWEVEGPPDAERGQFERRWDAEFIAHAPADIAALLAEVKDARAELNAVWALIDEWATRECIAGYRIRNDSDSDSECLHCAAARMTDAINGSGDTDV